MYKLKGQEGKKKYKQGPAKSESTVKTFVLFFSVILECCAYLSQLHVSDV